jgi:hydroxyacyl-ACP dehydratase HTD2-like protein with hotdog domain
MADLPTPAGIGVGEALPSQERRPTTVSVFLFAAALWTPHRIHYDQAEARAEGFRDILVHGPLLASYVLQSVTDWLGTAGRVTRFAYRNLGMGHPDEVFRTRAVLTAREGPKLTFAVGLDRGEEAIVEGTVEAELWTKDE